MANYNVGNIEIGVMTSSKETISNITTLINQLNKLDTLNKSVENTFITINKLGNGLQKIQKLNFNFLKKQFDEISISTKTLNEKLNGIENPKFGETATQLNRLGNAFRQFDKLKDFDFRKMYNSFNSLNRILDPFLQKLKQSETSLVALNGVLGSLKTKVITNATNELKKTTIQTKELNMTANSTQKSFSGLFNLSKIYFFWNYSKRLVSTIEKIITQSIAFEETLNKFQTSFGGLKDDATKFANEITYAFNLSTESVMNYMSTFNSMLKGMKGLTGTQAGELSKTLTQLALDYSSLFNVGVDSAMNAFQSVLSGQIRTIRSVSGIDVSETSIFQYYQELGGTKSIRQLSQLEKRLLRIYAVERQMDALGAVGDLEKTINSSSNMIKQFQETIKELARFLGDISRKVFEPVIKYALSTALVLKDLAKSFAVMNGIFTKEYDNNSANKLFGDIEEGASDAEDSVNSLMGKLSFDRFESLSSNKSTTEDLTNILNAIKNYTLNFSEIKSDARNIADEMLNWLGYTSEINEETGEVIWKLNKGYTNIEKIRDVIGILIGIGITKLIYKVGTALLTTEKQLISVNTLVSGLLIYSILKLITGWKDMSTASKIINSSIAALSATILIFRNRLILGPIVAKALAALTTLGFKLKTLNTSLLRVGFSSAGFLATIYGITMLVKNWNDMSGLQRFISILGILVTACLSAAVALGAFHSAWTLGAAAVGIIAGIATIIASVNSAKKEISQFADGGFPTKGNLFIANEAGPELVGNIGGRSAVANNDMIVYAIEEASYKGFMRAMAQNNNQTNVNLNVSGINDSAVARALFNPIIDEAKRNGYAINKKQLKK